MMHSAILLKAEVKALQAANEQKKRRERKRKRRIMQGGSLSIREGEDILQSAEVNAQLRTEVASETTQQVGSIGRQRRCGTCGNMGHNAPTSYMSSSTKRSVLITGCSVGSSGHALALEFANRGMRVFATARSTNSLSQLEAKGIEILPLDVTSVESIAALKAEITKRTGGKLDILFNNAGTMYEAPAVEADIVRVRQMFDTNVFGLFDMTQAFLPLLLASASESRLPPTIINTSSIVSRVPFLFSANYNASKAAVTSYSDTLRLELAPLGIKVVTLFMGEVSTKLMSPDNISFGANSLYIDAEAGVQERSRSHAAKSIKPDEFARQVAHQIFSNPALRKGEYVWKGTMATLVWFLNAVGFRKIFDTSMESAVGLNKRTVKKAIYDNGQRSIKQE
ncbi:hypothetical protein V499_01161 [Pseudogymnoascus sp. VKM F-103]|nr:hypothetical protein V499_01161 [Pseudogymnoascus sp. VKM F-103]